MMNTIFINYHKQAQLSARISDCLKTKIRHKGGNIKNGVHSQSNYWTKGYDDFEYFDFLF